ncbi:MAG: hypothetical protein ABIH82_00520 [Candidatus Woesearchaeota archaeon]
MSQFTGIMESRRDMVSADILKTYEFVGTFYAASHNEQGTPIYHSEEFEEFVEQYGVDPAIFDHNPAVKRPENVRSILEHLAVSYGGMISSKLLGNNLSSEELKERYNLWSIYVDSSIKDLAPKKKFKQLSLF